LTSDGRAKSTDFGIGKVLTETQPQSRLTQLTFVGLGSSGYISPEQAEGKPAHSSDDVYALAVILLQMLTNSLQSPRFVHRTVTRLSVPQALQTILLNCLDEPRESRIQTARELLKKLESLQETPAAPRVEKNVKNVKLYRELSSVNPLDWFRLLLWIFISPSSLIDYRKTFGVNSERKVASWLISTLTFFPLFILFFAGGTGFLTRDPILRNINLTISMLFIFAWLVIGITGQSKIFSTNNDRNDKPSRILAASLCTLPVIEIVLAIITMIDANVEPIIFSMILMLILFVVISYITWIIEMNIESGQASLSSRIILLLSFLHYIFLIWYLYFDGWAVILALYVSNCYFC